MQKSKLIRKGRKGFTLVEVALAVAVGLIIIGGAVLGYNAVKDNAASANARNRVLNGMAIVEEFSSANGGRYPDSAADDAAGVSTGQFTAMWQAKHPDDAGTSPWGGAAGDTDGVSEYAGFNADFASQALAEAAGAAASTTGVTSPSAADAANLIYVSINRNAGNNFARIVAAGTASPVGVRNYAIGIYGKDGSAFWDVKGGK